MAVLISADPARLEAYTEATTPVLARVRAALETYREALTAFNAAEPNDLDTRLVDCAAALNATLQALATLDELPSAFAAALRHLDAGYDPAARAAQVLTADDPLAFSTATAAHLVIHRLPRLDEDAEDGLRRTGQWIDQWRNRGAGLGAWFEDLPDAIELVIEDVTTTLRRSAVIVEEATAAAWRRAVLTVDELEHVARRWSVSLDLTSLRRAAPFLRTLGVAGDAATGAFAAWDQWDADATRQDLTSTERVLRAGVDGIARASAQATISFATAAAAAPFVAAAPVTGGLSLLGAGAVLAAGVVAGEKADPVVGRFLDDIYESRSGWIQDRADEVDDSGRSIQDAAIAGGEQGSRMLDEVGDWLDDVRRLPWAPSSAISEEG